ncbi:MAG TPA: Gfo/Idh/MocA family oxidoreductase [Steroidobacteraceae bacterium]|nr:Gfo/Idh/MocA family oxidoreductase [Steroidobacteraceae bacterium]
MSGQRRHRCRAPWSQVRTHHPGGGRAHGALRARAARARGRRYPRRARRPRAAHPAGALGRAGPRHLSIDTCAISLRARSGALIQINNSRRCAYGYDQRIEAFGAGGMLQAGNRHETSVAAWNAERTTARDVVLHSFIERYAQAYEAEMDVFVAAIAEGQPLGPDFTDGVEALRLAVAAGESLRTGRVVDVGV